VFQVYSMPKSGYLTTSGTSSGNAGCGLPSPERHEIVKTYYKLSPTLTMLLEQRPLLKSRAKTFFDGMLPGIRKKVEESNKKP
jgi:hypothetical protein